MKPWMYWPCGICLVVGVLAGMFLFKGQAAPAPKDEHAKANSVPAAGTQFETGLLEYAITIGNGDTYVSDRGFHLWLVRGNEAMPVRIVDRFSSRPSATTMTSASNTQLLARKIRISEQNVIDEIDQKIPDPEPQEEPDRDY